MVAIIVPRSEQDNKSDLMKVAADAAQAYLHRLLKGHAHVRCECGKQLKYISGDAIHCPECGIDLNIVGFITQYGELYVRTTVDLASKRFRLAIHTNPELFEDIE